MTPEDVLTFWFEESGPKQWFKKSDAFDADIRRRFEDLVLSVSTDAARWTDTPENLLALIVALDQFPRNMYRGTKAAFAWDGLSLGAAKRLCAENLDLKIAQDRRAFIYMPFMHSESLAIHDVAMELFSQEGLEREFSFEKRHQKVIETFGRYPHRNHLLGRVSTAQETAFFKSNPQGF